MTQVAWKTPSAHAWPLLIKDLLFTPVAWNPDREIVYRGDRRMTYAEFRTRVCRLATMLRELGVREGDTVAVMDWDSHRYLECFFAVPMIGAVLHTVNIRLSPDQLVYTMDHAEDDILLVHSDFFPLLEQIKGRIDTIRSYVLLADDNREATGPVAFAGEYEALLAASAPCASFPDFDENNRATTFYTTGTTGMPKGVYFSHRQLVLHTMSVALTLSSNRAEGNFSRDEVYMPITPMFHVHAWGFPYIATFFGVKQVYPGRYMPDILVSLLDKEGVTYSHCVPTILHMILKHPSSATVDLSRWKVIIGGAALTRTLCLEALARGIDIVAGYGMSETCPVLTTAHLTTAETALPREEQASIRCRTGRPLALVDLAVVDADGNRVAADDKTAGEIHVRAPWLTQGYMKDNSNSEKLWTGGWLHTNDVAVIDTTGSIRITDRKKDMIKAGGEWLSSLELEDILIKHPSVGEVALIGMPDEHWGEVPLAIIVLKDGSAATERELVRHVKEYVDRGMIPKEAILMKVRFSDAIDKTSVGKTNKVALRQKHAGSRPDAARA